MPLSDRNKHLLYEIYSVSYSPRTTFTSGAGTIATPTIFDENYSIRVQLVEAIVLINSDESKVSRVTEILDEYDAWNLDFSSIDREGYALRPGQNLQRVQQALSTYTGIIFSKNGRLNKIILG